MPQFHSRGIEVHGKARKKGVSELIGGAIVFTILFTSILSYFLVISDIDHNYQMTARSSNFRARANALENLEVTSVNIAGHIGFYVNNTGSVPLSIVSSLISNATYVKLNEGPPLPITLNEGSGSQIIDTGVIPSSGVEYAIKLVTMRGNTALGIYPEPVEDLSSAIQAETAKALGLIGMNYQSLEACVPAQDDCLPSGDGWDRGWKVTKNDEILFRVQLENFGTKTLFFSNVTTITAVGGMDRSTSISSYNFQIKKPGTVGDDDGLPYTPDYNTAIQSGQQKYVYFGAKKVAEDDLQKIPSGGIYLLTVVLFGYTDTNDSGIANDCVSGLCDEPYAQSLPYSAVLVYEV